MTQFAFPRHLPHRKGWYLVHYHDDTESCTVDCYYSPSLWSRVKAWIGR